MSNHAKPPFTVGIEDLKCPACENESGIYVREDVVHTPDERAEALCDDCGARLTVSVKLEPYYGDPQVEENCPREPPPPQGGPSLPR
jgi:hypothetical protein